MTHEEYERLIDSRGHAKSSSKDNEFSLVAYQALVDFCETFGTAFSQGKRCSNCNGLMRNKDSSCPYCGSDKYTRVV